MAHGIDRHSHTHTQQKKGKQNMKSILTAFLLLMFVGCTQSTDPNARNGTYSNSKFSDLSAHFDSTSIGKTLYFYGTLGLPPAKWYSGKILSLYYYNLDNDQINSEWAQSHKTTPTVIIDLQQTSTIHYLPWYIK